jgi:hypothetical protein
MIKVGRPLRRVRAFECLRGVEEVIGLRIGVREVKGCLLVVMGSGLWYCEVCLSLSPQTEHWRMTRREYSCREAKETGWRGLFASCQRKLSSSGYRTI